MSVFSKPSPAPPPPPPAPVRKDPSPDLDAARKAEEQAARNRRGRSSTVKTLLSEDTNNQGTKRLLGE